MPKLMTLLSAMCVVFSIHAQESVNSSGGDISGAGGSISYTLAQVANATITSSTGTISEGVQQSFEIYSFGISSEQFHSAIVSVFPNPATNYLILSINDVALENVQFELIDQLGHTLQIQTITDSETHIDMELYPISVYSLLLTKNQQAIKSFKIVKH